METLTEGKALFLASRDAKGKISKELEVFYNPVMKFNRDVSVLLLNSLGKKDMQICDLMAGSGVRSLRFLKELNKGIIKNISVNDYDAGFPKLFKKNLALNKITLPAKNSKIAISAKDANIFLLESMGFDYIDIDPFGSPNPFLESAVTRISRDGILAVTATDTAPLCGTYSDACQRKYWAKPVRNYLMHEVGLRILIRKVQLIGATHDKALVPIYAYYRDHYFRAFFRCVKGKQECDEVLKNHQYILCCGTCGNFVISRTNTGSCCKKETEYAGPMWTGPLKDSWLASEIARASSSVALNPADKRFLETIATELDHFGFYDIHALAKKHDFGIPPLDALMASITKKKADYAVSRTHVVGTGIKTTMPFKELLTLLKNSDLDKKIAEKI